MARVRRLPTSRAALIATGVFLAAALISGFTMLRDVDAFDEGLVLQAARRVAAGQVPYRDFLWAYGPAHPYLLAGLMKLFGVSLLPWRILRVAADAGVTLVVYGLLRASVPSWLALLGALAVATEMAEPRSANPFAFALLAVLVAVWLVSTRPPTRRTVLTAAALTAIAAAFRLDFALYGVAALTVMLAVRGGSSTAAAYAAIAAGLSALVYLPFAIVDGPASLYQALVGTSLHTGAYWSLPFPLHYHAPAGAGLAKMLKKGLDFYVPLLVLIAYALSVGAIARSWYRDRRPPPLALGLVAFGAGALAYLLSRTDEFHAQPLFVVATVLLGTFGGASSAGPLGIPPRLIGPRWSHPAARPRPAPHAAPGAAVHAPRPFSLLCLALLTLLLAHGVGNRLSALLRPPAESTIHVAVADGAEAPSLEARAIEQMVALVDANVPRGGPIYVLPRRSDLVRFNDPLIYVLAQRENPTAEDFGLLTGAAAQARIVRTLSRVLPRIIVRWTDPISSQPEPNLRGRSSGVYTLDRWVAAHYRLLARLYHYDVLISRG